MPKLVELTKAASSNRKVLPGMHLERSTSHYKLVYGLAQEILQRTVQKCKKSKFSLTADEATAKTRKKVVSILVSYVDEDDHTVKVQHLASIEVCALTV